MTPSETYTSKDGRVTVRDYPSSPSYWLTKLSGENGGDLLPKTLFPDPQLLADQVAEQQPKQRYRVHESGDGWRVLDDDDDCWAWFDDEFNGRAPDDAREFAAKLNERAEQAAAALNARAVSDE